MDPVLTRRSIRTFVDTPVDTGSIELLLKAAMTAPSADDERPWHFIVITDNDLKRRLSDIHSFAYIISNAPAAILVCGDESLQKVEGFWVQDCAAATENILIEANTMGLGSAWLGIYPNPGRVERIRAIMNIPDDIIPFSLVILGYPGEHREPANRFDLSRVHHNSW